LKIGCRMIRDQEQLLAGLEAAGLALDGPPQAADGHHTADGAGTGEHLVAPRDGVSGGVPDGLGPKKNAGETGQALYVVAPNCRISSNDSAK
jgi:hypothetical protein